VNVYHAAADIPPERRGAVLVPTMGALHAGHKDLIAAAAQHASTQGIDAGCIVSIYVNPAQFNDPADFEHYPKTPDADLALCEAAGAAAVYTPSHDEMDTRGRSWEAQGLGPLPPVATDPGLEDAHRPGHFAGVALAVSRLFDLLSPAAAVFGEKDWQQLQLVRWLASARADAARDNIDIIARPTLRDTDGLALSSRNARLKPGQRRRATALSCALDEALLATAPRSAEEQMEIVMHALGLAIDYAAVRDAETLMPVTYDQMLEGLDAGRQYRSLVAGRLGDVRLIDNAPWRPANA